MIKGWYTKHKDTWHQIEDVKDTGIPAHKKGGGNKVKLKGKDEWVHASELSGMEPKAPMEKTDKLKGGLADKKKQSDFDPKMLEMGIRVEMEHTKDKALAREIAMDHLTEDSQYYVKLKDIEKYDRVDEEADGKKELDYGKEELDKKWKRLRKAVLDSSSAIMPIEEQGFHDEDLNQEGEDGQAGTQSTDDIPAEDQAAPSEEEDETDGSQDDGEQESPSPEELEQMLRDEGYSDAEIAHIIHGHIMPEATVDDIKVDAEKEMSDHELEHKKRMNDLDYQLAASEQDTNELDKDHKQRLLDLEFEYAKKEKELEFEYKKKELDFKLENQKQKAAVKIKESSAKDIGKSRRMDAAKTSKAERAGK